MPNYPMHTGGIEQDRSCDVLGFDNVSEDISNMDRPTIPKAQPMNLQDAVTRTSDTQKVRVGITSHDITMRSR
jgi:hypothetical protein